MTLIENLEEITATQDDDYFSQEYKLSVLNDAKDHIINLGISLEKQGKKSLRFLDPLRVRNTIFPTTETQYELFYLYNVGFPSDLNDWFALESVPETLSELQDLYELRHGNAQPTKYEGYFTVYNNGFNVYTASPKTEFILYFIKNHSPVQQSDSDLTEITSHTVKKAVLYYAAMLMASVDATLPKETYQNEYQNFTRDLL